MRIALVGCGRWGRHILRDLGALGCQVWVVARSAESRRRAAERGAAEIVSAIDGLADVRGVVVATPTVTHAEVVTSLLALEVPVFVEKPLTADVAEAERLLEAAGERVFVMDKWRYHPGIEALAEIARSGELGQVNGLRTARVGWGHSYADVDTVRIHAPHDLAIALEILDELPEARSAVGEHMGDELTGLVATLGDSPWVAIEVSASSHRRRREVRLICEGGTAWLEDGYADRIGVAAAGRVGDEPEWRPISTEMPLLRELRAFVEHLDGGPPPRSSAAEGAAIVGRIHELRALARVGSEPREAATWP